MNRSPTYLFIVHQLVARERGDGLEEKVGGLAEVAHGHRVEAFVDLQPVPAVPISAFLHHGVGSLEVGLNELCKHQNHHLKKNCFGKNAYN